MKFFYLFLDLIKCIAISKFCDILRVNPTQRRIYVAGANINASFILIANNRQSYEFLVEDISLAHCLQFVHTVATATMMTTHYIFTVSDKKSIIAAIFFSQEYVMQIMEL